MLTQVEGYVNGTFDLIKNLPEEVAALPQNESPPCPHLPAHACSCKHASALLDVKHTDGCSHCNPSIHPERQSCVQVSDAAASQQQHMEQANNATYLLESFHKLVHDLEEPLGVSSSLK